jgi:hypothetical protein
LVFAGIALGQDAQMFERDIRPILTRSCITCHNDQSRSSGLSLSSRKALFEGGNRGPAVGAESAAESLLLKAVRQSGELKMPPGGRLSATEIAKLDAWIVAGAPWPETSASRLTDFALKHWAFQPIQKKPPPPTRDSRWTRNAIDHFILTRLEREAISPSPEADAVTLMRRVYLDLIGLPPKPQEVDEYLADGKADRYARLVDRLLRSPHYGERWARHWLDQARYADSDGGSRDEPRQIWRYRDWVIDALNKDLPFDRFVIEQIAGDLLPDATPEQIIATGFHRNSPLQIEAGTDREQYRVEAVADRVDTTGTVFLGLSTGCARCHDHKYDPISQREYYQLFAFFNNVDEYGPEIAPYSETSDLQSTHAPLLALGLQDDVARFRAIRSQLAALYNERYEYRGKEAATRKNDPGDKIRTATIETMKKQLPNLPVAMVMNERTEPRTTHVMLGGDYLRLGARVYPKVLSALHPYPMPAAGKQLDRRDLANWLVDPKNPLLARVTMNRIWQQHFGVGLVETENDFGAKGSRPTHPELLDWLASEFMEKRWSRKAMHRLIVTSSVYKQSSKQRPELLSRDARNALLARQSRLRLEAEIVRDSGLAVSGLINPAIGGPSVYPPQPEGVMETGQVKQPWKTSIGPDRYRRGIYTFHYRMTPNPSMKVFDAANGLASCTRRTRTNTPLQALTLLNDPNFHEMARGFADRVLEAPPAERINYSFRAAFGRKPSSDERDSLQRLLAAELDAFHTNASEAAQIAGKAASAELAAWISVCRVLLNTDEFITRE